MKLKDTDDLEISLHTSEYSCHKTEEKDKKKKNTAINSKGSVVPKHEESDS